MARLPKVGGDDGSWGVILNNYLAQSHNDDGTLKSDTVGAPQLKPNAVMGVALGDGQVTTPKIAAAAVGTAQIADQSVTPQKLSAVGGASGIASLDETGRLPEAQIPSRLSENNLRATIDEAISNVSPDVFEAPAAAAVDSYVGTAGVNAVACFGDSMFADVGSTGVTVPGTLSQILGVPVFEGGVGGHSTTEVVVRQGGKDVFVTVAGGTIPSSGYVSVIVSASPAAWRTTQGFTCLGSLAGVPGTLRRMDGSSDSWRFYRTAAGESVSVVPETRWVSAYAVYRDRVTLIRTGRNNVASGPETIISDDRAALSGLSGVNNRFLIISLYNTSTEILGSSGYDNVKAINNARAAEFGANYYDLRGWIIRNGLAQAGITPTTQDLADVANDVIPASLRIDNTHMNAIGREVEAQQLARILIAKEWISQAAPQPVVVAARNYVDNPRVGVSTSSWSVVGGGGTGSGARVATGGPLPESPSFYRATWTVPPVSAAQILVNGSGKNLIEAGKTYTAKVYVRASWAGAGLQIVVGRTDGSTVIGTSPSGSVKPLVAGEWTPLPPVTFTAEATAICARLAAQIVSAYAMPTTADTLDVSTWFMHEADDHVAAVEYRDGDMDGWEWSGTPHDSPSTGTIEA